MTETHPPIMNLRTVHTLCIFVWPPIHPPPDFFPFLHWDRRVCREVIKVQNLCLDTGFSRYIPFRNKIVVIPLIDKTYLTIDCSICRWFALSWVRTTIELPPLSHSPEPIFVKSVRLQVRYLFDPLGCEVVLQTVLKKRPFAFPGDLLYLSSHHSLKTLFYPVIHQPLDSFCSDASSISFNVPKFQVFLKTSFLCKWPIFSL